MRKVKHIIIRLQYHVWSQQSNRKRSRAQRKGRPTWLVRYRGNIGSLFLALRDRLCSASQRSRTRHLRAGYWVGANYGPVFRRLWTKVHQIMSADAGEIVCLNAVFRLSISYSVPGIFAIEVRSHSKSRQNACFSAPNFLGEGPQILDLVF